MNHLDKLKRTEKYIKIDAVRKQLLDALFGADIEFSGKDKISGLTAWGRAFVEEFCPSGNFSPSELRGLKSLARVRGLFIKGE